MQSCEPSNVRVLQVSSVNPDLSHVLYRFFCILKKLHGHESLIANLGFQINLALAPSAAAC